MGVTVSTVLIRLQHVAAINISDPPGAPGAPAGGGGEGGGSCLVFTKEGVSHGREREEESDRVEGGESQHCGGMIHSSLHSPGSLGR